MRLSIDGRTAIIPANMDPPPKLIIICGLSFAGKSTLGKAIAQRLGYSEVDVDETKVRMYGRLVKDTKITAAQWTEIYSQTDREIQSFLVSGCSVVDASRNFRKSERDRLQGLASRFRARAITIYADTPESVARARWIANRQRPTRRDITDVDFEEIVKVMEPPTAQEQHLTFGHGDDIAEWISKYRNLLDNL